MTLGLLANCLWIYTSDLIIFRTSEYLKNYLLIVFNAYFFPFSSTTFSTKHHSSSHPTPLLARPCAPVPLSLETVAYALPQFQNRPYKPSPRFHTIPFPSIPYPPSPPPWDLPLIFIPLFIFVTFTFTFIMFIFIIFLL